MFLSSGKMATGLSKLMIKWFRTSSSVLDGCVNFHLCDSGLALFSQTSKDGDDVWRWISVDFSQEGASLVTDVWIKSQPLPFLSHHFVRMILMIFSRVSCTEKRAGELERVSHTESDWWSGAPSSLQVSDSLTHLGGFRCSASMERLINTWGRVVRTNMKMEVLEY